jgi:hypothetical protein
MTAGLRTAALLSLQRALWGMVTPDLRGVAMAIGDGRVHARMIYEQEPTDEQLEIISEVETLVIADFLPEVEVVVVADTVPPDRVADLLPGEGWVYLRREARGP